MPDHCSICGHEITDTCEFCPGCNANIRAMRAEAKVAMLEMANRAYKRTVDQLEIRILGLRNCLSRYSGERAEDLFANEALEKDDKAAKEMP